MLRWVLQLEPIYASSLPGKEWILYTFAIYFSINDTQKEKKLEKFKQAIVLLLFPLELVLMSTSILFVCEFNQSTASFFQDRSVSLGRLIGIRPGKGNGDFYFPSREGKSVRAVSCEVSRGHRPEMSQGNCIPLLVGTLEKMSRSKSMKFNGYKH